MILKGTFIAVSIETESRYNGILLSTKNKTTPNFGVVKMIGEEVTTNVNVGDTIYFEPYLLVKWYNGLYILDEKQIKAKQ